MKYRINVIAFLLVCFFTSSVAKAEIVLGTNSILGGVPVSCMGAVTTVDYINDLAIAVPGKIVLSPALLQMAPVIQVFVYAHECAHQVPAIGSNENAADCWAVKLGRNQGWLWPQGLSMIAQYFAGSPGDWTHLPGPLRIQQMVACYNTP